ncbi:MAG TPA: AsmA family protein, partial [Chitinophagales bacterium]
MKKFLKIVLTAIIALLLLSIGISMAVRIPAVQDFVLKKVLAIVRSQTDADVRIGSFSWSMLRDLNLHDFYLGDKKGDTLIYAKTLNIDLNNWSLVKKEFRIKAVRLENAKVFLETDTSGGLNVSALFAANKKAGNTANASTSAATKSDFSWATSLDEVFLENVDFTFKDGKKKQQISVQIPELNLEIDETDLQKKLVAIRSLEIEKPNVVFTKFDSVPKDLNDTSHFHFMPKDWLITWKDVTLNDGKFAFNANYKPKKESGMDFNHIAVRDINFAAENGVLNRDSVKSVIKKLEAVEKSGIKILSSKGNATVSLNEIRYEKFKLITANSELGNQFSLKYSRFDDFYSFLQKVSIGANLKDAKVSLKDLNYFIKGIEPFAHNTLLVSGKVKGKISSLQVQDLFVRAGNGTSLSGNLYAVGLPKAQETFLNVRVKSLTTNATDLRNFAPTLSSKIPKNVNALGNIHFTGDLDGFVSDFVAHGNLLTDIGNAQSDLNFKYNPKTTAAAYTGNLHLQEFDLGKWFNDSTIGVVSANAEVNGKGVKLTTLDTKIDGTIESFVYKNYDYRNIVMNGRVRNKSFEGDIISTDPNVDVTFHGKANWSDSVPEFIFNAQVRNLLLKELYLTKADYQLSGTVTADFTGKNIDNLNGLLAINPLSIRREDER